MAPPAMRDQALSPCFHGCLIFPHRHFLPQPPPSHPLFSAVNSSPRPGIAPRSLNSSSQLLRLPEDLQPCLGYVWLWQRLILILFRLPEISCFSLSLKCLSSDSASCPEGPLLQSPHPLRAGPVLTLLFLPPVPSSYRVFRGSVYSLLLVRYSCQVSAGVLHALVMKVYSRGMRGERCAHVHLLFCHLVLSHYLSFYCYYNRVHVEME